MSIRLSNGASFELHLQYGKNAIAHGGPVLWNIIICKDKNFCNTSYKNLKRKIDSMEIFKELTFKETSTTTTNFRCEDFCYILAILEKLFNNLAIDS